MLNLTFVRTQPWQNRPKRLRGAPYLQFKGDAGKATPDSLYTRVGKALVPWDRRKYSTRKFRGFYRTLEDMIGCERSTFKGWFQGRRRPSPRYLERLIALLEARVAADEALLVELRAEYAAGRTRKLDQLARIGRTTRKWSGGV
jgi:hypothetical protein